MEEGQNHSRQEKIETCSQSCGSKSFVIQTPYFFVREFGSVVQLVRALPCHGRSCGFESRPVRQEKMTPIIGCCFFLFENRTRIEAESHPFTNIDNSLFFPYNTHIIYPNKPYVRRQCNPSF